METASATHWTSLGLPFAGSNPTPWASPASIVLDQEVRAWGCNIQHLTCRTVPTQGKQQRAEHPHLSHFLIAWQYIYSSHSASFAKVFQRRLPGRFFCKWRYALRSLHLPRHGQVSKSGAATWNAHELWNSIQFQDVSGPRYSSRRDSSYFVESTWDPRCPQTKRLFSCTLLALSKGDFENSRVNISVSSRNWVRRDRKRAQARKWVESGVKMFTTTLFLQNVYFVFGIAVSILFLKAARFDPWPESGRQSVEWLKTLTAWTVFRRCRLNWENLLFFSEPIAALQNRNTWTLFTANLLMHPVLQGQALQQWCRDFLERHRARRSRAFTFMATYLVLLYSCCIMFTIIWTRSNIFRTCPTDKLVFINSSPCVSNIRCPITSVITHLRSS